MGLNIHQLFNVVPKRLHRIVHLAVGSFIIGATVGLALLILTPFFAAVGDTPSHLITREVDDGVENTMPGWR